MEYVVLCDFMTSCVISVSHFNRKIIIGQKFGKPLKTFRVKSNIIIEIWTCYKIFKNIHKKPSEPNSTNKVFN